MPIVAILEWPATEGLDMKAEYATGRRRAQRRTAVLQSRRLDAAGSSPTRPPTPATGGGLIVDVWEDQAHMDAWMKKVMPLIAGQPEPSVRILETINVVTAAQPAHV